MDKILVIIPVMNLWDRYTIHCLESLVASKCEVNFEVLVIDNASVDDSFGKAQDFANRKLPGKMHVIRNEENVGCAGGWNVGLDYALKNDFSHVLIANNDVLFSPFAIQRLYKAIKDTGVALVSAVDVAAEVSLPTDILDEAHQVNSKETSLAPHPNFSCFMISRKTIDDVGFFDESFFPAYFEDNDYHYRIKIACGENGALATLPATFYHFGSKTQNESSQMPVVQGTQFEKNRDYFAKKWGGVPGHEQFNKPFNNDNATIKDVTRRTKAGE